jgi:assimilatory nitrate reductase catalytic subunit
VNPAPRETRSTCPYCGVGCGVVIESRGSRITGVRGDPDHPANHGRLCSKGATLHLTADPALAAQTRLWQPLRRAAKGSQLAPLGWDEALDDAAARFEQTIRAHGRHAVGFYVSGQLLTEDYYVFNKIAKGLVGTNNIDSNSRLCMSSAVAGYKATLGADAPPACYDDLAQASCVFIAGSNTAFAHPILFRRLEDARRARPGLRVVVVDPRRTDTADSASLHLPIKPGSDVTLFMGMLAVMDQEGWIDRAYIDAHTSGFDAALARARAITPAVVQQACGIDPAQLERAARWFAAGPTLSLYCQGLNQSSSGTAKNAALVHLHLATGQIGKPGAGPLSLTGQPNAMGGREVGAMANLLSAHRELGNAAHRAEVAALWGVASVPEKPGKTALEMFEAVADGEIKALWIACTNPAQSLPDQRTVRRALERCEFVVLQEAFAHTATADYAHLLLPATTWGEKEGTVTNSERRITRVRAAVPPPGEGDPVSGPGARHDWAIATAFGRRLQARLMPAHAPLFPYETPESIWNEHRESTRGRDLDITGLSYAALEAAPAQWPFRSGADSGSERLYADGVFPTADGRARFVSVEPKPLADAQDMRFPLSLNTGRLRDQWHGMSRTGLLGRLYGHVNEPAVDLHPAEMARRGIANGDWVHLTGRRGSLLLPARASDALGEGQAYVPMHWGSEVFGGKSGSGRPQGGINQITSPAVCPISRQPELKHTAVKVLKATLPWSLLAMAWLPADGAARVRQELRGLMDGFDSAYCLPFGREGDERDEAPRSPGEPVERGVLLRAVNADAPAGEVLERLRALMGLDGADALRYQDAKRGQQRALRVARTASGKRLVAFMLAGDTGAAAWIQTLLLDRLDATPHGRLLLSPTREAPSALAAPRARQICSCKAVHEDAITAALAHCVGDEDAQLRQLQERLACGTQCGSCVPEVRRLIHLHAPQKIPAVA